MRASNYLRDDQQEPSQGATGVSARGTEFFPSGSLDGDEQFRAIFETTPECVKLVARDGTLLRMNASGLAIIGAASSDAVVGGCVYDLIAPEDRASFRSFNERVCDGERGSLEFDVISLTGARHHMETHATPLQQADGRTVQLAITRDVTERRSAERAALLLGAIVDSSDDAILSKDLNGVITSWNKSAERVFGHTASEAVGQSVASLLIPADRQDEEPAILARLRKGERVEHFQTIRRHKNGSQIHISLTISPIRDARGVIIGASKIARDITAQVQAQEALHKANDALKQSNADLEQFAYSASHDLQEPLRMVSAYGELLRKRYAGRFDAQADEYLGYVVDGALRMERLLRDLRAFTRASTGEDGPAPIVDSNTVLAGALGNLRAAIEESHAVITTDQLPTVCVHGFRLEQVFLNIIGNAIRYRSAEPPRIHVSAVPDGTCWRFSVTDNGIGIQPEYKEEIFGLFKRLHTTTEYAGTGMGLAICQRIIERAGGRIWVESELGRGATFQFLLPSCKTS